MKRGGAETTDQACRREMSRPSTPEAKPSALETDDARTCAGEERFDSLHIGDESLVVGDATTPVTVEHLSLEERAAAAASGLPLALEKALHRRAVALGREAYLDPSTGAWVFTSSALKRRVCCGNGCRHCPHGHVNVPAERRKALAAAAAMSW